jgi:hypothetical protein
MHAFLIPFFAVQTKAKNPLYEVMRKSVRGLGRDIYDFRRRKTSQK